MRSGTIRWLTMLAMMLGAGTATAQIPCQYELVATIQGPNCGVTGLAGLIPTAISPNGMYVTGWYGQCDVGYEAFLWIGPPPGTFVTIPRPSGVGSARAMDVNDVGTVCGSWRPTFDGSPDRGFVYRHSMGHWTTLPAENPNGYCYAMAINNAGTVVGYRGLDESQWPAPVPTEAFIWNDTGGFQGLGVMNGPSSAAFDISENGFVSGWTGTQDLLYDDCRAFIRQGATSTIIGPIPDGVPSIARGVNYYGQIAIQGKSQTAPVSLHHSYIYDTGAMIDLPTPVAYDRTSPSAITDVGFVVGGCSNSATGGSFRSCVWQGSQVALLADRISPLPWNPNLGNGATDVAQIGAVLVGGRLGTSSLSVAFILLPLDPIPGDADCDQHIDIDDLLTVINTWGPCVACPSDFDHNRVVNVDDLLTVILNWSP